MDIPLDGRVCYFPLTDGSAIVTKQVQSDGTSKTVVYKPVEENKKESPKYVTFDDGLPVEADLLMGGNDE